MPLIPSDWLADHVELPADITAEQLAADLVRVGLEEEEIHGSGVTGPLVVGKVLTKDATPQKNGKLINYCRVDVGEFNDAPGEGKEPYHEPSRGIICGAHNFEVGNFVVVALPGAVLPGNFEISARKTYGHLSDGMITSEAELGLSEDHSGIIVLAKDDAEAAAKGLPGVGEDVMGYLGLDVKVLEINVTPDRGYCFAMRGVAREYSHSTGARFTDLGLEENLPNPLPEVNGKGFPISVEDQAPIHGVVGCDRFVTRIVTGVDPNAKSPKWLQDRLTQAGMRPISLAVDATNYVMLDLGQPLHAYDLDTLVAPIVVRRPNAGETLVTLDGQRRELNESDLLITDSKGGHGARAVGLAGTMGGMETEITDSTTNVMIEAAHFDPVSIARMARQHKLPSEASKRFERGVDPQVAPVAAQRVVDLLVEYGGGTVSADSFDYNEVPAQEAIDFDPNEVKRLTSLELEPSKVVEILRSIGCEVAENGAVLQVTPPSWRPDLVGPAHFVEEVARLVGYDQISDELPTPKAGTGMTATQRHRRDISRALAEQGWSEVLSYPFVSGKIFDAQGFAADDERRHAVVITNPLQDDAPYIRTSLLDTLLSTAHLNVARGNQAVAIFESGTVTRPAGIVPAEIPATGKRPTDEEVAALKAAIPSQPHHIAGVAVPQMVETFGFADQVWDWRDAIEAVFIAGRTIDVGLKVENAERAPWHPGRCGKITAGGTLIGYAGELDPRVCKALELPARTVAFEFDADALIAARGEDALDIAHVRTSPMAKEDIALVVDESVTAGELIALARKAGGDALEDVRLFDIYTGDQIPEGKKSLALALRFRADHTLTAKETAELRNRIVKKAKKTFKAELRG